MSTWVIVAIIVFVLAFILSNIMLLKKSANHKFSSSLTEANTQHEKSNEGATEQEKARDSQGEDKH